MWPDDTEDVVTGLHIGYCTNVRTLRVQSYLPRGDPVANRGITLVFVTIVGLLEARKSGEVVLIKVSCSQLSKQPVS